MSLIKVQIKRFDLSVILEIISYSHDTWQDCDLLSLVGYQGWGIWCVFGNSDILQVTVYCNFSHVHVIQFAWFRMEDTDYSVAGSPLKTWIRGEEIIPSHYDMISILCRRLTVQWPCQSPWIWLTFENIEWVRKNSFMNIDWACQDRHNEGTDQNLICTRCYPSNDTLQGRDLLKSCRAARTGQNVRVALQAWNGRLPFV